MNIDTYFIDKVELKSSIDFRGLLGKISSFLDNNYSKLVDYFLGKKVEFSPIVFQEFELLRVDLKLSLERLHSFRTILYGVEYFDFLEKLEILLDKLDTINNLQRWLRSSIQNFSYQKDLQLEYIVEYGDTFEKISRNVLHRSDFLDNWFDIALSNSMLEENYTVDGGNLISLPIDTKFTSYSLNSVVDSIQGKSCYGKDISLSFLIKENDLVTLGYLETIEQSVGILIQLRKGDNLDKVEQGIQEEVFVGSNRVYFNTPILIRQLVETFHTDDTLVNFKVKEIRMEQDNFFLDFQVQTILGEIYNKTLSFS